jgi:hypothetical protein
LRLLFFKFSDRPNVHESEMFGPGGERAETAIVAVKVQLIADIGAISWLSPGFCLAGAGLAIAESPETSRCPPYWRYGARFRRSKRIRQSPRSNRIPLPGRRFLF